MTKEYDIKNLTINELIDLQTEIYNFNDSLNNTIMTIFHIERGLMSVSEHYKNRYAIEKDEFKVLQANIREKIKFINEHFKYVNLDKKLQIIKEDLKKIDDKKLEVDDYIKEEKAKIAQTIQILKEKEDLLNNKLSESILTTKGE
jgi:hypothetical protein